MLAEQWNCPRCNAMVGQACRKSFKAFGAVVVLAETKKRYPCKERQKLVQLARFAHIRKRREGK